MQARPVLPLVVTALCVLRACAVSEEDLGAVTDTVGASLGGLFAGLGSILGGGECAVRCRNGEKALPNLNHKPKTNGCGAFGVKVAMEDAPEAEVCCDKHDLCYDTCGNSRADCDAGFKTCLLRMCKRVHANKRKDLEACQTSVGIMHAGAVAMGCTAYKESQKAACICEHGFENDEL